MLDILVPFPPGRSHISTLVVALYFESRDKKRLGNFQLENIRYPDAIEECDQ